MPGRRDDTNIWKALSNQVRRDLIVFIGEKGVVSFTEIKNKFGLKIGTLYHHLDTLGELITQDQNKYYCLTERGKRAYALIEDEIDVSAYMAPVSKFTLFFQNFFLRPVYQFITKDSFRTLGFSLLIFIGLTVLSYFLSIAPFFLIPTYVTPAYFAPLILVLSTLVLYIISDLLISLIFNRKQGKLALFQGVMLLQIPLALLSIALYFSDLESYPYYPWELPVWLLLLFLLVQIYCLGMLIENFMVVKELRVEKAGFIALIITYFLNFLAFTVINYLGGVS